MAYSNCWSDVLRTYWSSCVLFIDLRTGTYQDLSSYSRAVTLTNAARAPYWETRLDGQALNMNGVTGTSSGYLTVATAAALDLRPDGTIVVFPRSEKGYGGNNRFAYKRNPGVTCAYDMYDSGTAYARTGTLNLYDGATAHALGSFTWPDVRSIAATFTAGSAPWGYVNGVRLTPPATLWASTADGTNVILPGPSGVAVEGAAWWGWLMFAARLSGQDLARLHADFMRSGHVL